MIIDDTTPFDKSKFPRQLEMHFTHSRSFPYHETISLYSHDVKGMILELSIKVAQPGREAGFNYQVPS